MTQPRRILGLLVLAGAACFLLPAHLCAQILPPPPPSACDRFNLATGWKGTFTIVGSGSGTFPDGGSYSINESISATPDLSINGPGVSSGALNETIHIDDLETHPDPTAPNGVRLTHIVDDETIPRGPVFTLAGLPGAAVQLDLANCKFFEFDFDISNNATTTTELGVLFTQGEVAFLGGQQGGINYAPGAITAPLPTSGLALSTSFSFSAIGSGLSELATWTITLSLQPVLDLDLIVSIPQYSGWRPTAGRAETDTGVDDSGKPNLLDIQATLRNKSTGQISDVIPDNITFKLADFSSEPGVSMNWPSVNDRANPSPPDLSFDPKVAANQFLKITANGTQADFTPLFPSALIPFEAMLSPHDWGAWATLDVTATISDQTIQGHFQGDPNTNILLPKRQSTSQHVADVWKDQQGVPLSTPDNDDSETGPDGLPGCVGDGFTLYEEYRGFMENGKHIEGDPKKKDFFIQNLIGADAEPGITMFTRLTQLKVHKDVQKNEMDGLHTDTNPPHSGTRLINFNHASGAHVVDQHGVYIRTCKYKGPGQPLLGGLTELTIQGVHGRPGITDEICMQPRDAVGQESLNSLDTHLGSITAEDAFIQYDVGVAHELMHSTGVDHHGEGDAQIQWFTLIVPGDPRNTTGQPFLQLNEQNVQVLSEQGDDLASAFWQRLKASLARCQALVADPVVQRDFPLVVEVCQEYIQHFFVPDGINDLVRSLRLYVGNPRAQHSGNDACVMRYFFANVYPSVAPLVGVPLYYTVTPGTEQVGFTLCNSPAGTGVNDPNRNLPKDHPQPRYFDAARGDCQHQVCVNDKNAPAKD